MNQQLRKRRKKYRSCILLLAAALTFSSALPAMAADGSGGDTPGASSSYTTGTAPVIGKVGINAESNFELKNVMMHPETDNNTVIFTVRVNNGGASDLLFVDYWVRIRTKDGSRISVHTLPQDKEKNRITAKSSQDINFYATVNSSTSLNDLTFDFIKWDFSQPGYERIIGSVAVPQDYSTVTAAGQSREVSMGGSPIKTTIEKLWMTKNEKNYTPTVVLNLQNVGSRSVTLPDYQYLLRTADGLMYPLTAKGIKDLAINPQVDKDVELTGTVPVSVSTEGWQLIIVQKAEDLKLNLPIASFALPQVSEPDTVAVGKQYQFTNEDGIYTAQLNSLLRLPWEDQDILTADFTLSNQGVESLPIPDLTGYFMLDDAVKVEAKLIRTDQIIGLPVGASARFQFIGKMPYTYDFGKVKLVLQEKEGGDSSGEGTSESSGKTSDLLEFEHRSDLMSVPFHFIGESYKIDNIGRSTSYAVRSLDRYTGETADTLVVQLEATNLEKRFSDVTRLVSHFQTTDGTVYPATIADIKKKISPNGQAILFLQTVVPKGLSTDGMHIMIGEAVTEDKLTPEDGKPDAFVNAASFWLPKERSEVQDSLKEIDLTPFRLSISKVRTLLTQEGVTLKFNYELSKNLMVETNNEGRKIVLELKDDQNKIAFTREYDFKDFDGSSGEGQGTGSSDNGSGKLKLGSHDDFEVKEQDPDLIYLVEVMKNNYSLNVYDSFNGQKKLLATTKIRWFSTTD